MIVTRPILICGAGGQVGRALIEQLGQTHHQVVACDRDTLDIRDAAQIERVLKAHRPSVVVNTAAYTAVDRAETEADDAFAINGEGSRRLALACAEIDAALISYSTDYVFDGTKSTPYGEADPVAPANVYGRSKWLGEDGIRGVLERHVIVRTSWVFSAGRPNFVTTILRLGSERDTLRVVDDEFGCPTHAGDVARTSAALIDAMERQRDMPWGTYHFCGAEPVSRYRFAEVILREAAGITGKRVAVVPIKSAGYPTAARRPPNAILDCRKIAAAFGVRQPDWHAPLAQVVRDFHRNRMTNR